MAIIAEDIRMPVYVESQADDSVGKRLVYQFKEGLKKSESMYLTYVRELGLKVTIVTLEGDSDCPGTQTVYSIVWLWDNPDQWLPFYLTSSVGYCGYLRVEDVAESLVAETNEQSEMMIKFLILSFQEYLNE